MNAHTPGPWIYDELTADVVAVYGDSVASPPDGYDEEIWPADAVLIAAAPDLLAALKAALAEIAGDGIGGVVDVLESVGCAAVAKAEGG